MFSGKTIEGGIEKKERQNYFAISEKVSVIIHEPEQEGEKADIRLLIEAPEGHKELSLLELLPSDIKLQIANSEALVFGYAHEKKVLTTNRRWFEKDSMAAFLMTLHEAGHTRDAVENNKLYLKPDREINNEELAQMELGADDQMVTILETIKERYGDHGIPKENIKRFVKNHLLGYQVGVTFNSTTNEIPQFLHLRYQPDLWNDRQHILQKTKQEIGDNLEAKIQDLHSRLQNEKDIGTDKVKQTFLDTFGDVPYLNFAILHNPQLFEDLSRNITLDEFLGGGFNAFRDQIDSALLHEKLGVVPFIAHEKLLTEESKAALYA